ncbi:roadblock/LC7 domain-containing protein [Dactylosporangium sp. NPDC051485]|uniref:roadblock/LC7 domain-containing protein n=1 Tax=Dactylosporangium sp. NPDC051485 TaxID=3154846 RepID=UPI003422819D
MTDDNETNRWGFLLAQLCRTPGVANAIAVSADGLLRARSEGLARADAETLAAVTSGISSLAVGAARVMASGTVTRNLVETTGGFLVIVTVNERWILAVVAAADCDLGQVGFEIDTLANAVNATLEPAPLRSVQHA